MDIAHYRRSETLARQAMATWRHAQAHHPHVFATTGFPTRVESSADLLQLLDTMQEARFMPYQQELAGLSETDVAAIVDALADYCRFHSETFHSARCALPLSTMLAHYALYAKLKGWSDFRDLLEIGPGCGYLSFFLRRHRGLAHYAQIEVTESFYLLQHLVNRHCFGARAAEHAALEPDAISAAFGNNPSLAPDRSPNVAIPCAPVCHHWPWWKLGELARHSFDIITSNANLTEMSEAAFVDYARLMHACLKDDGAVIIQCFGGGPLEMPIILQRFHDLRFAPLVLADAQSVPDKPFVVVNAVFIGEKHPLFPAAYRDKVVMPIFPREHAAVQRMYFTSGTEPHRVYSAQELADRVSARLSAPPQPGRAPDIRASA